MLVESSRAPAAPRRTPTSVISVPASAARPPLPLALRNAAFAAGSALTLTGRGDMWTLALAFGVADASAVTALVVGLAAAATLARAGTAGLADVAGGQAVLGAAGFTGSGLAIAATWATAVSVVLAARDRWTSVGLGALAGVIVFGPSLASGGVDAAMWVAGVVVGGVAGWVCAPRGRRARFQPLVALAVGAAAIVLGVISGYG